MRSGMVAIGWAVIGVLWLAGWHSTAGPEISKLTASDEMTVEGEAATLRQAYVYLEAANLNYHGHRGKAMRAVGAACRELGGHVKGDARHHEDPTFSDNLLGKARSLLLNVLPHAQSKGQASVVSHIQHAVQEIEAGLSGEEDNPPHKSGKGKSGSSSSG